MGSCQTGKVMQVCENGFSRTIKWVSLISVGMVSSSLGVWLVAEFSYTQKSRPWKSKVAKDEAADLEDSTGETEV